MQIIVSFYDIYLPCPIRYENLSCFTSNKDLILNPAVGDYPSVRVVTVGDVRPGAGGDSGQLPSVAPGKGAPVIPGRGIADRIVGDRVAVVGRQKILPVVVPVGVGIRYTSLGSC